MIQMQHLRRDSWCAMGGGRAALQGWPVRRGLVSEQRIPLSRHLVW